MAHTRSGGPTQTNTGGAPSAEGVHSRDISVSPALIGSRETTIASASVSNDATSKHGSSGSGAHAPTSNGLGPSVARIAPVLSLVEWRDRERQEQIERLLEMVDDLRKEIIAGKVTTLALAGVADGKEFCQWDGEDARVLYTLELTKAEVLNAVRFSDEDEDS